MTRKRSFFSVLAIVGLLAGSGISAFAQEARPLKLGVILPLSGPLSFVGVTMKESLDLLVEQFNAKGGMSGHPIRVTLYDTESNSTLVGQHMRRLVESDNVDIVIGPTVTGETLVARPIANELKMPLLPFAGTEAVTQPASPYLFAFVPSDRQVAQAMVDMAKSKGLTKIAFLHSADGFGQTGTKVLNEIAAASGVTIAAREEFGPRDTDMTPQIMRIRSLDADVMFVWGVNPGPTIVMKNAKQIGFNKPIYNSYGVASQQFITQAGPAAEGSLVAGTAIMGALLQPMTDPVRKNTEAFVKAFESRYGKPVAAFNGYVFDAVNLVDAAIKANGGNIEREQLATVFRKGGLEYIGANGHLKFKEGSSTGQSPESGAIVMLKIEKGKFVLAK